MISVVIPLYNKEKSIGNTIRCVLAQTFQDFEIVIVDDGSTDNSANVVKQFTDERIHLMHQENTGVSAARNKGIAEAKGEYIAFLDADDEWLPNHLEELNYLIVEFPQCKAFATSYVNNIAGVNHNIILNKMPFAGEHGILVNYFEVASCSHPPICSITACISKQLLLQIGGFPIGVISGEDLLTWARVAIETHWAYSLKSTAIFISEGYTNKEAPKRYPAIPDYVGQELLNLYKKNRSIVGFRKYVSLWHKMRASVYLRMNMTKELFHEIKMSIQYNPKNIKLYIYILLGVIKIFKKQ